MKTFRTFISEQMSLDELSTNTLGRYATKAHNRAVIAARMGSGGEAHTLADKRAKGAVMAVQKLGRKIGTSSAKAAATKTSNNIKIGTSLAKDWRKNPDVNTAANANHDKAEKGIASLWNKADKRKGR